VRLALLVLELKLLLISWTPHEVYLDNNLQHIPNRTEGLRNAVGHRIREMLTNRIIYWHYKWNANVFVVGTTPLKF